MDSLANITPAERDNYITQLGFNPDLFTAAALDSITNFYELSYFLDNHVNGYGGMPDCSLRQHGLDPRPGGFEIEYPGNEEYSFMATSNFFIGVEFLARYLYDSDIQRIDGISLAFGLDNNRVFVYMSRVYVEGFRTNDTGHIDYLKPIFRKVGINEPVYRLRRAYTPYERTNGYADVRKLNYRNFYEDVNNPFIELKSYFIGRHQLMKIIKDHQDITQTPLREMAIRFRLHIQKYNQVAGGVVSPKKYLKLVVNAYKRGLNNSNTLYITGFSPNPAVYEPSGRSCTLPCPPHCPE